MTNLSGHDKMANGGKTPKAGGAAPVSLKKRLRVEHKFIEQFLQLVLLPKEQEVDTDDEDHVGEVSHEVRQALRQRTLAAGTSRATSGADLRERLQQKLRQLSGQTDGQDKRPSKKLGKAERRLKMKEENRVKAKLLKQAKGLKPDLVPQKPKIGPKPVLNDNGQLVFSKFDFTDEAGVKSDDRSKTAKAALDAKSALLKLRRQKDKVKSLVAAGKADKAKVLEDKAAWQNALDRSSGIKVKDNELLLKKSIKKIDQRKKQSQRKWAKRLENEKHRMSERQSKRTDNIGKRKRDKKDKAKKKAIKKGRVIPGFH